MPRHDPDRATEVTADDQGSEMTHKQSRICIFAVMHTESIKLRIHVEVQKAAVCRNRDAAIKNASISVGNGACRIRAVIGSRGFDVRSTRDVKDVYLAVHGLGDILTIAGVGVAGQYEELAVVESKDFGLGYHFGVLARLCRRIVV